MNKILQIFVITIFFSVPAFAQDIFSWQDCVDLAKKNNNSLKLALAGEKSGEYMRNASASGFLPQVSGTIASNRGNNGNSTNPSLTTVQSNINQSYNGYLALSQNLFSGFLDVGKFDQAKANYVVTQINVAIVKAQISYDLKYSYQNLSYAKETVKLLDDIIRRRQDNLRIIELRFKGGMENKGSLLLAQAYLESAKYDRLQGSNLVESAKAQLCKAMGISDCKQYDIKNPIPINEPPKDVDFGAIVETVPLHFQALAQEQASKAGITIAQAAFFPSINLTLSRGNRGEDFFPKNDYWAIGTNVSWSFFSGGRDFYTTRSAYSNNAASKENREVVDQQILITLKQANNSYVESVAKLKVDEGFQNAAKMRADIARSKYNNGLLTFEDWDVIETDLINRQKSYLQSKLNRVVTEAAWEQSQGRGIFNQ